MLMWPWNRLIRIFFVRARTLCYNLNQIPFEPTNKWSCVLASYQKIYYNFDTTCNIQHYISTIYWFNAIGQLRNVLHEAYVPLLSLSLMDRLMYIDITLAFFSQVSYNTVAGFTPIFFHETVWAFSELCPLDP